MSAVTAREVLGLLEQRGARLLAGAAGLDRAVSRVSTMRARSPAFEGPQGGELALLSLATLRALRATDESLTLTRFIQDLASRGVAAIAVVGVTSPPETAPRARGRATETGTPNATSVRVAAGERPASSEELALATTLEVPLLGLPWGTPPGEVEREVLALISARRAATSISERDTLREVYDALVRASLRGESDSALGQRLADMLGIAVSLEDERDVRWCHLTHEFPLAREPLQAQLRRPSARAQLRALESSAHLGPGASTPGAVALPPAFQPARAADPTAQRARPQRVPGTAPERPGRAQSPAPLPLARGLVRLVAPLPVPRAASAYLSLIVAGVGEPPMKVATIAGAAGAWGPDALAGITLDALADLLAQIAPLFALVLARQHDLAGVERRLRTETLDALLTGTYADEAQMRTRAQQIGHDLGHAQTALVVELHIDGPNDRGGMVGGGTASGTVGGAGRAPTATAAGGISDGMAARVADALASGLAGAWVRARGNEAVALVPLADGGAPGGLADLARQAGELLARALGPASAHGGWSAGLGQPASGALEARRSYTEARDSARLGLLVLGPAHVARVADLGIYRLLLRLRADDTLAEFCRQMLGSLTADKRAGDTLVETLEVYFACNGNLSEAARRLDLHRNSLIYRLKRARELLGYDLDDAEARLALQLALKGHKVLGW